jgi:hypothetical protein
LSTLIDGQHALLEPQAKERQNLDVAPTQFCAANPDNDTQKRREDLVYSQKEPQRVTIGTAGESCPGTAFGEVISA